MFVGKNSSWTLLSVRSAKNLLHAGGFFSWDVFVGHALRLYSRVILSENPSIHPPLSTVLEEASCWPTENMGRDSEARCRIDFGPVPVWSLSLGPRVAGTYFVDRRGPSSLVGFHLAWWNRWTKPVNQLGVITLPNTWNTSNDRAHNSALNILKLGYFEGYWRDDVTLFIERLGLRALQIFWIWHRFIFERLKKNLDFCYLNLLVA